MPADSDTLCDAYLASCEAILRDIHESERASLDRAAALLANALRADRLIHVYGPGGHSNLAAQEIFYRAGGLMQVSPILDPGTLLSEGAMRSTAMERLPGYGRLVIEQSSLASGDVLLLVNAFGINAAVIDAAGAARERGAATIGISSHATADRIPADHPARHPSRRNLHTCVDVAIDSKVPDGDAALMLDGCDVPLGPTSTIANTFVLNTLVLRTVALMTADGAPPALWRSRNGRGGDTTDSAQIDALRQRIPLL